MTIFPSPHCNLNGEKSKHDGEQAVTYLASTQNEHAKD